jgi:ATP adenylyltransferase
MAEFNTNLWAPWRMEYIRSLGEQSRDEGCFLCHYRDHPDDDAKNRVLWRTAGVFVVMNRFPYTNGHLLVALSAHKGDFRELSEAELCDLSRGLRDGVDVLRATLNPQGFNIGYNLGHCAGAGLPDHLHAHIVPRWSGDTNFMAVVGDSRVIPDSLDAVHAELSRHAQILKLGRK